MQVVVITGSTRGIGRGLAHEMLARGAAVVVSGRSAAAVDDAVRALGEDHEASRVAGVACDVTALDQVQALWDAALERFERVDVWINNAGMAGPMGKLWELDEGVLRAVVDTNVLGTALGCRVAVAGMLAQGGGAVWNMEGLGSDGRKVAGLATYGTTKAGVRYLTDALVGELKGTAVRLGAIRPGMVVTDMLLGELERNPDERERLEKVYNVLADRVETVTPWIAERVLANPQHGTRISWLGGAKVMGRFMIAPFRKRDVLGGGAAG